MSRLESILWEMFQLLNPGEYGLGESPPDKEAWERLGRLVNEALKEVPK